MFDSTRIRAELTHVHRTLAIVATGPQGRDLAHELRRAIDATVVATIWGALFADCLRVVHCAAAADGEIGEDEVETLYELVFSIARHYAGLQPSSYGEFGAIEQEDVREFLRRYADDGGPFGRGAEEHWPGLMLCRRAAELGESEALERYERLMSWLITVACQIGGVTETDPRWESRVHELHELREALASSADIEEQGNDLRLQAFLSRKRVFSAVQQAASIFEDDPFDVETIHSEVRATFAEMVERAAAPEEHRDRGRMLLILGDSGSGKTHLLRGLRRHVHEYRRGFVAYAQLNSSSDDYTRYLLQHVVDSLAHSYAGPRGERSGLVELASGLVELGGESLRERLEKLSEDDSDMQEGMVNEVCALADELVKLNSRDLEGFDPDLLRVLLCALRPDPRTTSRIYKYLRCENMNEYDRRWICGAVPRNGKDDPHRMILNLGRLAFVTRRATLVLMIDQVEQSVFDASSATAFRKAIDTLHAIVGELPSAVAVVACLSDLYAKVRGDLTKFMLDRLERDPKFEQLQIRRSYEEIQAIVGRRLSWLFAEANAVYRPETPVYPIPEDRLRALTNWRTRDVLDWCHQFQQDCAAAGEIVEGADEYQSVAEQPVSTELEQIAAAWNDALHAPGIEVPSEDDDVLAVMAEAAKACADEIGASLAGPPFKNGALRVSFLGGSQRSDLAIAMTNNAYQRGSFAKQLETLRTGAKKAIPIALRTSPFPRGESSNSAIAQLLKDGGRAEQLDESTLRALVAFQRFQPEFSPSRVAEWRRRDRPLSGIPVISRIFDLENLAVAQTTEASASVEVEEKEKVETKPLVKAPGRTGGRKKKGSTPSTLEPEPAATNGKTVNNVSDSGLLVGTTIGFRTESRMMEAEMLLRHTGILGSSGSGKTTLALNLIEQALERDVAVILIDRKGDLAGYAKPDWWQHAADPERARRLADRIDVRLFTPGTRGGRPLSLSVVPDLEHVPEHEKDRMIRYAAQALAGMMRFGETPNDTARLAILMQAIAVLAERKRSGSLPELISLLENRDDALIARAGRYDDRLFKRLLQDLETIRLSEAELFDEGAEQLTIEALIGRKEHGKVPLTIASTRFLGDAERIQSWVAHLLACLSRHLAKSPSAELHTLLMIDEADLYMPAGAEKPASKEPLQDLLKRARAGGLGVVLASQSPADLDYRSREQINTWFLGRIADRRSIEKMKPLFESRPTVGGKLALLEAGRFVMLQEGGTADLERTPSMLRTEQLVEADLMSLASRSREVSL